MLMVARNLGLADLLKQSMIERPLWHWKLIFQSAFVQCLRRWPRSEQEQAQEEFFKFSSQVVDGVWLEILAHQHWWLHFMMVHRMIDGRDGRQWWMEENLRFWRQFSHTAARTRHENPLLEKSFENSFFFFPSFSVCAISSSRVSCCGAKKKSQLKTIDSITTIPKRFLFQIREDVTKPKLSLAKPSDFMNTVYPAQVIIG